MAEESIVLLRLGCALRSEAVALQSQESYAVAMQRFARARRGEALLGSEQKQRRWNDLICYGIAWNGKDSRRQAQL